MLTIPSPIRKVIPPLYGQDSKGLNAIAYVKFFDPASHWTWYATEYDGMHECFGLVVGHDTELGYFSLVELESYRNCLGLGIEIDLYFQPTILKEVYKLHELSVE